METSRKKEKSTSSLEERERIEQIENIHEKENPEEIPRENKTFFFLPLLSCEKKEEFFSLKELKSERERGIREREKRKEKK